MDRAPSSEPQFFPDIAEVWAIFSFFGQQEKWPCGILFKYLYPLWLLPERPNSSPIMRIHRNGNKSPRVSISNDIVLLNCFLDVTQYRVSSSWFALVLSPARLYCPRPNYLPLIIVPSTLVCTLIRVCLSVQTGLHFLCWFFPPCLRQDSSDPLFWVLEEAFFSPRKGYQAWRWAGCQWQKLELLDQG